VKRKSDAIGAYSVAMTTHAWHIAGGASIPLDRPRIMAIVNVTPDSFSDGGENLEPAIAAAYCATAIAEGAAILDVGGESTRPGAVRIPAIEQIHRVVPAIRAIRDLGITAPISVDTTLAEVAIAAIEAGAGIVNDVSAGAEDARMMPVVAERRAGMILMHRRVPPGRDAYSHAHEHAPDYSGEGGVVRAVRSFLASAAERAIRAGLTRNQIAIDPGLGFGKSVAQNYQLIARAPDLLSLGFPVISAASRKSFLGAATGQTTPSERVEASVAVSVAQYLAGVRIFRVHDISAHARALAVAEQIASPGAAPMRE